MEMSSITDIAVELDEFPQGTAIMVFDGDGEPVNVAYRTVDLDDVLGWALAGKADPFTSETLAKILVVRGLTFEELDVIV